MIEQVNSRPPYGAASFFVKLDEKQLSIVTQIAIGAAILAVAVRFHEGDPSRI